MERNKPQRGCTKSLQEKTQLSFIGGEKIGGGGGKHHANVGISGRFCNHFAKSR